MIKILYDYQAFEMQRYGGISRYFANIIQEIENNPSFASEVGVLASKNYYLSRLDKTPKLGRLILNFDSRRESFNRNYCRHLLSKGDFDVFHPTYYHPYFLKYLKKPFVLTVHDMIHERFPAFFPGDPAIGRKRMLIQRADRIIAISNATKLDILTNYPEIDEDKIEVVYHGHNPIGNNLDAGVQFPKAYLLFVGERGRYKNFFMLIDAFAEVMKNNKDLTLLCIGGGSFSSAERDYLQLRKVEPNVHQMSLSDNQIFHAYNNALFFIYPSLYEGFGLPILEAFESSCPVIVSDILPFREVAGDAALYCNSTNRSDIVEKIQWALSNQSKMKELAIKGTERLKMFSMEACMSKTLNVYTYKVL